MSFLGIDIGTASSKGVVVNADGNLVAVATRHHDTSHPNPGWFEHDAHEIWWIDTLELASELAARVPLSDIEAIGVSGIGPVALVTDQCGQPLRPAILYGIDTRAHREIGRTTDLLGEESLLRHTGNRPTSQSIGPKLMWLAANEPDVFACARRWYTCSNYVVGRLTGEYVVDHYSASASDPLYDLFTASWWDEGWALAAGHLEQPRLAWPGEIVGTVQAGAARETGLRAGIPVVAGTVDAMAEAYSAGCEAAGDTMVMYGSTMFCIELIARPRVHSGLWAVVGRQPGTYALAAGMATSGLITTWLSQLTGESVADLFAAARTVPAGSDGLVLLPYFAGERTPLFDPEARGCWIGLTLQHTRAHLSRSVLEGVAYGVRHNIETMAQAGARPARLVAVGGGTQGELWTQIVSDVTGCAQDVPSVTVGASLGDARMAADALSVDTSGWNPVAHRVEPDPELASLYDRNYTVYRHAYPALRQDMHSLTQIRR